MVKAGTLANLALIAGLGVAVLSFSKAGGIGAIRGLGTSGADFLKQLTGQGPPPPGFGPPGEEGGRLDLDDLLGPPFFPDNGVAPPIRRAEGVGQDDDFPRIPPPRLTPARAARAAAERTGQLSVVIPAGASNEAAREFVHEIRERGGSIGQITFTGRGSPAQLGRLGILQGEEAGAF